MYIIIYCYVILLYNTFITFNIIFMSRNIKWIIINNFFALHVARVRLGYVELIFSKSIAKHDSHLTSEQDAALCFSLNAFENRCVLGDRLEINQRVRLSY